MPADRQRFLAKLPRTSADAVVLDLEDGAGAAADGARANVAWWVSAEAPQVPPALFVRTREVDHPGFAEDVRAAVGPRLTGLVLPKVAGTTQVKAAAQASAAAAAAHGLPAPPLVLIVESARGLEALQAMLAATDRVRAVGFGAEDLSADLGLPPRGERETSEDVILDHARARVAVACAAAEVAIRIDTPCLRIDDEEGLVGEVVRALSFGFGAKFLIHPGQVEPLHRALLPSPEEISWAERALAASPTGGGALRVDGRMVDEAILRQARAVLTRAAGGR
ncbi:MAG: HpcH/HpaI aldolase/citrate lyase family protein [Trueperaceae bacterium]|nr:HpcH/HpaI aldolase/citrate lyase family protein [Trueperaceae bacterium]MCO5173575.1 aldolase/citrate lyase family protein [Trueperaceae bacterium]MCW5818563.1 HpcH/HpaI aldolase/citrate lyase family protein [Trueperaceae bacterium]